MNRRLVSSPGLVALLVGAFFLLAGSSAPELDFEPQPQPPPGDRVRGVGWVAGGPIDGADLDAVRRAGADWIAQTPFGWQNRPNEPGLRLVTGGRVLWGETDEGLETTTRLARERGLATLLKPHVWLSDGWRGELAMTSEADWRRWFGEYETFILHYAGLAERLGIEALAVGTELHRTVVERPEDWRRLIGAIRQVYSGHLTYAANWSGEVEEVPFWDLLDAVGVQAYYPLSDRENPSLESLREGWRGPRERLEALHRATGKPVVFTEIGYRAMADAAIEPWTWPQHRLAPADTAGLLTQARCYEAFFRELWSEPWVAGAFFWKWYPDNTAAGGPGHPGFTPQNKPAGRVLEAWYREADASRRSAAEPIR